ncbi:MAG: hypothetical protein JWO03_2193 [Bacteroidetes bacterium]|nr:hypothetical protein [Bacteroidota bacterium]
MARANADTIITYDTKHFRHFFHFKKQHSDIDVIVTESIDGVIDTELVMSQHGKIYTAQTAGLNFRIKTVDGGKAEWIKVSAKTGRNFIAFRWDVAKSTYSHYKCRGLSDREKQNSAASLKSTRRQAWQLKVVIP